MVNTISQTYALIGDGDLKEVVENYEVNGKVLQKFKGFYDGKTFESRTNEVDIKLMQFLVNVYNNKQADVAWEKTYRRDKL